MKIYVAHQISGLTFNEVVNYYLSMKHKLTEMGYEVLCPMTAKGFLRTDKSEVFKPKDYKYPQATNHAIFERDKWMVSDCDVLYCDFTRSDRILIGCLFEIAWAALLGKHTVLVIPDDNIHQHAFVLEAGDIVFSKTADAISYLEYLVSGRIE